MRVRQEQGATAVEFALVLPLVLALVGMLFTVALGMGVRGLLHRGVEAGAREAAVIVNVGATDNGRYRSEEEVTQATQEATILLGAADVAVAWLDGHRGEGARFTITASYTWTNPAARFAAPLAGAKANEAEEFVFTASTTRVRE